MTAPRRPALSLGKIFAAPIALAVVSAAGLTAALVGDGAWNTVSWLFLGLPVAVSCWYGALRRR